MAVTEFPQDLNRAQMLLGLRKYDEVVKICSRYVDLSTGKTTGEGNAQDRAFAYLFLGQAAIGNGHKNCVDEAIRCYNKCLEIIPQFSAARVLRAKIYEERAREKTADFRKGKGKVQEALRFWDLTEQDLLEIMRSAYIPDPASKENLKEKLRAIPVIKNYLK